MAGTLSRAPTPRPAPSASTSYRRQDGDGVPVCQRRARAVPKHGSRLARPASARMLRPLAASPDADATPAVKGPWPRPDGRCGPAARARSLRLSAGQAQTSG